MCICLEKAMAPHSSTLAWKIPWMEEPGRLQSVGSPRVGHNWVTSLSLFTFMHWRRKWQPAPVFLPGKSQGRGSLVGAVYGVAQSRTWLKRLSSSSSSSSAYVNPKLLIYPLPSVSPLVNVSLFWSLWVCFCFINKFICIVFLLDSTCKWHHMVLVFLSLAYFT